MDVPASTSDRVTFGDTPGGFEIIIKARKLRWPLAFIPFWLTLWTIGGLVVIGILLTGNGGSAVPFLIFWLVGWAGGWTMAALWWSWMAFGFERVAIGDRQLTVSRELYGRRLARSFPLDDVRNVRAAGYFGVPMSQSFNGMFIQMGLSGGTIAFDSSGGTSIRFGAQLEEEESRSIADLLRQRVPEN